MPNAGIQDGNGWKIIAKVKYKNFSQFRQLSYDFKLQYGESTLGAVNNYVMAGWKFGSNPQFLNGDNSFSGNKQIPYPFYSAQTVKINNQYVSAPEMYFLKQTVSFQKADNGTSGCTLDSNIIFFNGPIVGGSNDAQHNQQSLILVNSQNKRLTLKDGDGIVWFHNVSISDYGLTLKMPDGPYYFNRD